MATDGETVLQALFALLPVPAGGAKYRNPATANDIPSGGLLVLRDGSRGAPVEEYLNPPAAVYRHAAELQIIFQSADDAARSAGIKTIADAVKAALATDPTLGDAADHVELQRGDSRDETDEGTTAIRVEDASVILEYLEEK
jgi:hypothetical protein